MGEDIGGTAVHIAARVSALATPTEVLVSRAVKDLVAGSGIGFADRGTHTLKGIPDTWHPGYVAAVCGGRRLRAATYLRGLRRSGRVHRR